MEVEGVMKRKLHVGFVAGLLVSGTLVLSAGAQTTANPNPASTLPLPTQTNPAGTGGSNTASPNDPTAPTTPAPAPPPTQKAPPAAQQSTNPVPQQADPVPQGQAPQNPEPQKQTPQNQQSAPAENPAVQQTSPTGNNAITNEPNKTASPAPEAASPEAGNPQGKGSTTPGAAESPSAAGDVGSLNAGALTPEQLHQRIDAALHSEPTLSGSNLTVNVSDDAIDLSGTVNSSKERLTARRIVQSFAGNRRVRERVTVGGGGARNANPNPPPNGKEQNAPGEKSEVQNANRPITDPARHGDQSEEPRGGRQ
jgi:hypothetical protein